MKAGDEISLRLLSLLEHHPAISQRALSAELGLSLGKTHYCLRALIDKGWVKVRNFRSSQNKLAYAYALTPRGIRQRAHATLAFLQRKRVEYADLEAEIRLLEAEARRLEGNARA